MNINIFICGQIGYSSSAVREAPVSLGIMGGKLRTLFGPLDAIVPGYLMGYRKDFRFELCIVGFVLAALSGDGTPVQILVRRNSGADLWPSHPRG